MTRRQSFAPLVPVPDRWAQLSEAPPLPTATLAADETVLEVNRAAGRPRSPAPSNAGVFWRVLFSEPGVVEGDGRDPPRGGPRKVRAPEGRLPGNAWAPQGDGQGHREQTARRKAGKGETVG